MASPTSDPAGSPAAHLFSTDQEWQPHPRFDDVRFQQFESRDSHPTGAFSMMRVRVRAGGRIDTHLHETETETAYVLTGSGTLTCGPEGATSEHRLEPGSGVSIPPRLLHRLDNTGDGDIELIAIHSPPIM